MSFETELIDNAMAGQGLKPVSAAPKVEAPVKEAPKAEVPTPVVEKSVVDDKPNNKENPPMEEKPIMEEKPKVSEPTVLDEEKLLNGMFGGKFKNLQEVHHSYSELEKKSQENPFHNDFVKGLNDYIKGGGDAEIYMGLQKLNVDKMSPRDLLVNKAIIEGKGQVTKEEAEIYIDSKYKVGIPERDEDGLPNEGVREAQIALKLESNAAKEMLRTYIADNSTPPDTKLMEGRMKAWEGEYPTLTKEFSTIPVALSETEKLDYPVRAEVLKNALKDLSLAIKDGILDIDPSTPEGKETAKEFLNKYIRGEEADNILKHGLNGLKAKVIEEKHHKRPPEPEVVKAPALSEEERKVAFLNKVWG